MGLLDGVRVLDLTRLYPGPYCTMMMADMGADVIKVESPGEGDYMRKMGPSDGSGDSLYFQLLNRNKKSITLNLKAGKGVELFLRLAETADVVIEGFRPGVTAGLGIGYEDVCRVNPDVIYCSITGYGQDGPLRDRAGHDLNYIALAGILGVTGNRGQAPAIPGVQIGDVGGGAQMALSAVLAALYAREKGQGGRYIDVAMLDGLISWLPLPMAEVFAGGSMGRGSGILNGGLACYSVYETADGGYMSLGALEKKFWLDFCEAAGRPEWVKKHYHPDQDSLRREVAATFKEKTRNEWEAIFQTVDACCEPVLSLEEVADHPQVKARGMVGEKKLAFPVKFSTGEKMHHMASPGLGEHTSEVLMGAGIAENELKSLQNEGIL
jgi:crotonobetainyl-CoA:carnitine CoA-transferase CaiB-like acyl-CoA transferase